MSPWNRRRMVCAWVGAAGLLLMTVGSARAKVVLSADFTNDIAGSQPIAANVMHDTGYTPQWWFSSADPTVGIVRNDNGNNVLAWNRSDSQSGIWLYDALGVTAADLQSGQFLVQSWDFKYNTLGSTSQMAWQGIDPNFNCNSFYIDYNNGGLSDYAMLGGGAVPPYSSLNIPLVAGHWYTAKQMIDLINKQLIMSVTDDSNGQTATGPVQNFINPNATVSLAGIGFLGSGSSFVSDIYFDNIKLEIVPEPTVLCLLGIGSIVSLARRSH